MNPWFALTDESPLRPSPLGGRQLDSQGRKSLEPVRRRRAPERGGRSFPFDGDRLPPVSRAFFSRLDPGADAPGYRTAARIAGSRQGIRVCRFPFSEQGRRSCISGTKSSGVGPLERAFDPQRFDDGRTIRSRVRFSDSSFSLFFSMSRMVRRGIMLRFCVVYAIL